jgi:dTDP-glucose pyrophosphorylase
MDEVTGVVLAAGRGRRLGALGDSYVKALLPVANEPVIGHHLRLLARLGVRRVFVVVGHHADDVAASLGDGQRYGLKVHYLTQARPLGSAHALSAIRPYVTGPFLLILGDYYFVPRRPHVMVQRLARGESAVATKRESCTRLIREACAVDVGPDGLIADIVEKPMRPRTDVKGTGFYAFVPEFLDAVARTPRTALRDEYELTVAVEIFVRMGFPVYAEETVQSDTNITRPGDLLHCNLDWLDRHAVRQLVGATAVVDASTELDRAVVGDGAVVAGRNRLEQVVVFPGVDLRNVGAHERTLFTPQGRVVCDSG